MKNNENFNFYFIHNYKTLGTTLYKQMPQKYTKKYWGHKSFKSWESANGIILNKKILKKLNLSYTERYSIDHFHINSLIELNIIPKKRISSISFMIIIRHPIDRFISICNFHKEHPNILINKLKNGIGDNFFQFKLIKNKHSLHIQTIKFTNKKGIVNFFKVNNLSVNLEVYYNKSKKIYSNDDLKKTDVDFLNEFYKKDFKLYNSAI